MSEFMNRFKAPIIILSAIGAVAALLVVFVFYPSYLNKEFEKKFANDTEILCRSAWQIDVHIPKKECKQAALFAKDLIALRDADNGKYDECFALVTAQMDGAEKTAASCSMKAINELSIEQSKIISKRIEIHDSIKLGSNG